MKTLLLCLITFFIGIVSFAQVNKWTGAVNYNEWINPGNWSLNEVPNDNHDVVFDSSFIRRPYFAGDWEEITASIKSIAVKKGLYVDFFIINFDISGTGIALQVEEGAALNIGGGKVRYKATGALAQIDGTFSMTLSNAEYPLYDNSNCITKVTGTFEEYTPGDNPFASRETVISKSDSFFFESGSKYHTNTNGVTIPRATWDSNSTCHFDDVMYIFPKTLNQTLGNIQMGVYESEIGINSSITCSGDFKIRMPPCYWEGDRRSMSFSTIDTNISIHVGRDFIFENGRLTLVKGTGNVDFSVGRDFKMSRDVEPLDADLIMKEGSGDIHLKVGRNFFGMFTMGAFPGPEITAEIGGNLNASLIFSTVTNGSGFIRLGGNLEYAPSYPGLGTEAGNGTIEFNGTKPQFFSYPVWTSDNVSFIVKSGSILQMETVDGYFAGKGNFTLEDNATFGIKHPDGIYKTGTLGAVRVSGVRNFSTKANYIFNGNAAQKTGNGISSAAFITVENSGGYPLTLTNDSIAVGGNLHLKKGGLNAPSKKLFVGGDWINDAGTDSSMIPTIVFTGDSTGRISGTKQTLFNNIRLEKNNATTELATNSRVKGSLVVGSVLALETYNFTLGDTAVLSAGSGTFNASKMIIADSTGELRKEFTSASALSTYTFPIGNGGATPAYTPATIEFTDASNTAGYIGVNLRNRKHPENNYSGAHLKRYWTINQAGLTDFAVKAGFNYVDADVVGTEADLELGKWDGAAPWQIFAASVNTGTNTLQSEVITSFSDFTGLSDAVVIPPFAFGNLTATSAANNDVDLDFTVSNENEITIYEVERSSGNNTYTKIGEVNPTGNSSYEYTDTDPLTGTNVYRIKAIKSSSEVVYSSTASIEVQGATSGGRVMNVYPNPIQGNRLKILYTDIKPGKYQLIITNSNGNSIYSSKLEVTTTTLQQEIILNGSLPKGIYRVRVSNGADSYVQTFMK